MELLRQVLFWVLVTLAAGFIGYVGRYGAEWLLKRRRMKKEEAMSKEQAKVEKKRLKAAAKAEKKRTHDSE